MLHRVNGAYHFRRKIPFAVRPLLGKQEIWFSLRTSNRVTATARGGMVYGQVEAIFEDCRQMSQDKEYIATLEEALRVADGVIAGQDALRAVLSQKQELQHLLSSLSDYERFRQFIQKQAIRLEDIALTIQRLGLKNAHQQGRLEESCQSGSELTEALRQVTNIASSLSQIVLNNHTPNGLPSPAPVAPASPLFSEASETYLEKKSKDYKNEKDVRVLRNTFAMFLEIIGDKPVAEYSGKDAFEFIENLKKIPKNYGKSIHYTPVKDAIAAADFREKSGTEIERMSSVTVEKRVTFISGFWDHMLPIEQVSRNIWKGFKLKTDSVRSISDWSEENLLKLTSHRFGRSAVSRQTYAFITSIAAYSGMRQGEICHLRCEDFVHTDDGWMMYIREHPPVEVDGRKVTFSPKSEAGERVVPVHPELVKVGLIKHVERMRNAGKTFVFEDLKPSGRMNLLSPKFQQAFSRHKISAGISEDTVFHSFRHSVSTILRNEDNTIREVWIDAVLGHIGDSSKKSQGITTYLHNIGTKNLRKTINRIKYPESFQISKLFE
ncbi:phage integrase [Acetobacter estunensis NRIC 0472]|nr:phage integrase [Acetobacter estunensis NRIC 0472]